MDDSQVVDLGFIDPPTCFYHANALVSPDFNGVPVITVVVAGYPWAVLEWRWEESRQNLNYRLVSPLTLDHAETLVNVQVILGELSEEAPEKFIDMATVLEKPWHEAFESVTDKDTIGDGHGVCGLVDRVTQVLYGTENPTDPDDLVDTRR